MAHRMHPYSRFSCLRRGLTAINLLYILTAIAITSMAFFNHLSALITIKTYSGVIGCAVFLILLSVLGLIGSSRHNQVCLFFYMIILFVLFIVQFSISCALLSTTKPQQYEIAADGWQMASDHLRNETEIRLQCCGFAENNTDQCFSNHLCCTHPKNSCRCEPCWRSLEERVEHGITLIGSMEMMFSFSLLLGVWMTFCYRNTKDPRMSPNAFL